MGRQRRGGDDLQRLADIPAMAKLAKEFTVTPAKEKLADAAAAIVLAPDAADPAFMARQLVQCTLPHTNPGDDKPAWTRKNGNVALVLQPGWDADKGRPIGYPYGTIPRLLLFWITTEAVRTKKRRLELGHTLSEFMRELGLTPSSAGAGKRGDANRLKEQMRRLFNCRISFKAVIQDPHRHGERTRNMEVTTDSELWWSTREPSQGVLWGSWVELGERFFEAITTKPIPFDMRALRALKRSPLALDLYAWICYRAFSIVQNNHPPQFIPWQQLMQQLGSDYEDVKDFKKKAQPALRKVQAVYPGLTIAAAHGGFTIHANRLATPQRQISNR